MEEKEVEIAPGDFCPCGSGKRFEACCLAKGHKYGLFDYGKKKFAYDLDERTQYVSELMAFCFNHIITSYNNREAIDLETGLRYLMEIDRLHDHILEPFLRNSSCRKGCAECCHQRVETTAIEAEMIRSYVQNKFDRKKRSQILFQIKKNAEYYPPKGAAGVQYPEPLAISYAQRYIPCPFLSEEKECTIYSVRPLVCRICMAFSDPRHCKAGKPHLAYYGEYFPRLFGAVDCLSILVFGGMDFERHLPDWFLHELKL